MGDAARVRAQARAEPTTLGVRSPDGAGGAAAPR